MKATRKKVTSKAPTKNQKKTIVKKNAPQKRSWTILGIILLVLGLIIVLISVQQTQENRSRAETVVAQGSVPAQLSGKMGTSTVKNLTTGATYKVVVSGTYYYRKGVSGWNNVMADAQWSDERGPKTKTGTYLMRQNKPRFNGQSLTAQDLGAKFNANHTYTFSWKATGPELVFSMPDSLYKDNVGGLHYTIYLIPTNAEGTPIATGSGTLGPNDPGATASASPAVTVTGEATLAPSATVVPSATTAPPEPITPTLYCITTVGVTNCNDQGTPGAAQQPTSGAAEQGGIDGAPTAVVTSGATVVPDQIPCDTTINATAANDNSPLAKIWQQLKDLLTKLVGGTIDENNNNGNGDGNTNNPAPCPSITP